MKLRLGLFLLISCIAQATDIFLDVQYRQHNAVSRWFKSKKNNLDLTIVNQQNQTLLIKAVQSNNGSLAKRLLKKGISVNHVDGFGKTALDYAAELGHKKIILTLVKYKAKVTTQENMALVKQCLKSKYRFLTAMSSIFRALGLFSLCTGIIIFSFGGLWHLTSLVVLGSYSVSMHLISIPFSIRGIYWKDRVDYYNPNFIMSVE